ncbi:MAG TPA: hypothetical protein VKK31_02185 [Thermoanaerobaculia bacterium]|nr:hypothetical protein [Thermoanaerobaculia bacterium]
MAQKKKAAKSSKSARKAKSPAKKSARGGMAVAAGARKPTEERIAALMQVPLAVCEKDEDLQTVLNILRNQDEPIELRLAALQVIQAASFSVVTFEPCRGAYIATLREISDDPDPELRQRVLGTLAREKDGFVQKKLLEGLQNPEKALVSPEKALQLLSYDVHADAYPVAREILSKSPNADARREAIRLLAADANTAPVFEKILRDKGETTEIRQMSAAALNSVRPDKLQEYARAIVLDDSEDDELQATSLTAITQFGDQETVANDEALLAHVGELKNKATAKVKQGARRFLTKYGR